MAGSELHQMFQRWAATQPTSLAVSFKGSKVTYRELDELAELLADRAAAAGLAPGETGLVVADRGIDQIVAMLAILKAGGAFVVVSPHQPAERTSRVIELAQPSLVMTETAADGQKLTQRTSLLRTPPQQLVISGGDVQPPERTDHESASGDLAYVAFTSGSTGGPKGIPHTRATLAQFVDWQAQEMAIAPGVRVAQFAPPGFDVSFCEIFGALCCGASLHVVSGQVRDDPAAVADWIRDEQINLLQVVPSHWSSILGESGEPERDRFASLDTIMFVGEALPPSLVSLTRSQISPSPRLVNVYGPTEVVAATFYPVPDSLDPAWKSVPIGTAITGRSVSLAGGERPAEIQIASQYLTAGYLGDEPDSAFTTNAIPEGEQRVYRTGDLATELPDGSLTFAGRVDNQVKINGQRIELEEVELAWRALDAIKDAAMATQDLRSGATALVSYVVPTDPASFDASAAQAALAETLPRYMISDHIVTVDTLPRNANGKIDRTALPALKSTAMGGAAPAATESAGGINDDVESYLIGVYTDLLGVDELGPEANLFTLGGDSVLATRVLSRVRKKYAVRIRMATFFDDPTVAALSSAIHESLAAKVAVGSP